MKYTGYSTAGPKFKNHGKRCHGGRTLIKRRVKRGHVLEETMAAFVRPVDEPCEWLNPAGPNSKELTSVPSAVRSRRRWRCGLRHDGAVASARLRNDCDVRIAVLLRLSMVLGMG